MWEKVFEVAIANGLWAVLFLILLLVQITDGRKRECKYQNTIAKLSDSLGNLDRLNINVDVVKENVMDVKDTVNKIRLDINLLKINDVKCIKKSEKKAG